MCRDPHCLHEHYRCAQEQGETCTISLSLPAEQFTHTPLPHAAKYIRLLRARSRHDADVLVFELAEHPIDDLPPYTAISYAWGPDSERHKIVINEKYFDVRSNAREALQQTCRDDLEWYIWMDSICINQEDLEEKSAQVEMMADIYRAASLVYACIGPAEDDIEMLLEACSALDEARSYSFAIHDIVAMCEAFANLAHRSYWGRMWIVQEI
ncbi:uncharacterized protein MYCFIDRAFT_140675, partial [Pseudocercospora fijiensis CIRAD86]